MAYLNGQKVFLLQKTTDNQNLLNVIDGSVTSINVKELAGITKIRDYAFYGCSYLGSVELSSIITSIGKYAFASCSSLSSITIPASVQTINNYAFSQTGLTSVTFENGSSIGSGHSQFYNCLNLTNVVLSNNITTINISMFFGCDSLSKIDIPAGVTRIENSAFKSCSSLTKVILRGTTLKVLGNSGAFDLTPIASGTGYIYVDDTLVDSYKSATNWSTYASVIKGISELED